MYWLDLYDKYSKSAVNFVWYTNLPSSKSWHSEAVRPSFAELAVPSTYRGREEDVDNEYSLVFQKMAF